MSDIKYNLSHATVWPSLEEVYIGCKSFDPNKRFSLSNVEVLNGKYNVHNICDAMKLKVTQTTKLQSNCLLRMRTLRPSHLGFLSPMTDAMHVRSCQ